VIENQELAELQKIAKITQMKLMPAFTCHFEAAKLSSHWEQIVSVCH
jgi:hypothetical protein